MFAHSFMLECCLPVTIRYIHMSISYLTLCLHSFVVSFLLLMHFCIVYIYLCTFLSIIGIVLQLCFHLFYPSITLVALHNVLIFSGDRFMLAFLRSEIRLSLCHILVEIPR